MLRDGQDKCWQNLQDRHGNGLVRKNYCFLFTPDPDEKKFGVYVRRRTCIGCKNCAEENFEECLNNDVCGKFEFVPFKEITAPEQVARRARSQASLRKKLQMITNPSEVTDSVEHTPLLPSEMPDIPTSLSPQHFKQSGNFPKRKHVFFFFCGCRHISIIHYSYPSLFYFLSPKTKGVTVSHK